MNVRDLFPEFQNPSKDELTEMWRTGMFVLDTNALMYVVRLSSQSRAEFLDILERISGQLWIPHQIAAELYTLLESEERHIPTQAYESIVKAIRDSRDSITKALEGSRKNVELDVDRIQKRITKYLNDLVAEVRKSQDEYKKSVESPELHEALWGILAGKIGSGYSLSELESLYDTFDRRYVRQIPPGYMDATTKHDVSKYGDVIIWYQMLAQAKRESKPVLFVTNDEKDDWWRGSKRRVPRYELVREMRESAKVNFHMYTVIEFMKAARELLAVPVEDKTLVEAEELANEERRESQMTQRKGITVAQLQKAAQSGSLSGAQALAGFDFSSFLGRTNPSADLAALMGPKIDLSAYIASLMGPKIDLSAYIAAMSYSNLNMGSTLGSSETVAGMPEITITEGSASHLNAGESETNDDREQVDSSEDEK